METREITAVLLMSSKTLVCIQMFRISFIQTWYDDRYYCTLHFDTSLTDLGLGSRSQECKKAKTSALSISPLFINLNGILHAVETCDFFQSCFFFGGGEVAFPSYISGVHHFLGEIFAYVTVF